MCTCTKNESLNALMNNLFGCFLFSLYTEDRVMNGSLSLKEHFNRPIELLTNYMDQLVRGLSTQNTQKVDMLFTKTVSF